MPPTMGASRPLTLHYNDPAGGGSGAAPPPPPLAAPPPAAPPPPQPSGLDKYQGWMVGCALFALVIMIGVAIFGVLQARHLPPEPTGAVLETPPPATVPVVTPTPEVTPATPPTPVAKPALVKPHPRPSATERPSRERSHRPSHGHGGDSGRGDGDNPATPPGDPVQPAGESGPANPGGDSCGGHVTGGGDAM